MGDVVDIIPTTFTAHNVFLLSSLGCVELELLKSHSMGKQAHEYCTQTQVYASHCATVAWVYGASPMFVDPLVDDVVNIMLTKICFPANFLVPNSDWIVLGTQTNA